MSEQTAEHTWTDEDGDQVEVTTYADGDVSLLQLSAGSSTLLTRAQALELYHFLGGHLMATGAFPANVRRLEPAEPVPTCCTGEDSSTCCPDPEQEQSSVATEAHSHVYGGRQGDYGHPREDFTRTAILWTGLLNHKLADGEFITPEDMARCMIAVKLSRDVHSPKRDNRVDMAGYAITLDRLETGQ